MIHLKKRSTWSAQVERKQDWHLRLGSMRLLYMSFEITVVHRVLVLLGQFSCANEVRTESPGMGTYLVQDASVCRSSSIMQSTSCLSQEVTSKIEHEILEKKEWERWTGVQAKRIGFGQLHKEYNRLHGCKMHWSAYWDACHSNHMNMMYTLLTE